ncbi:zinc finger protein ztf-16 isoform X2 [Eupeodes corollae]|nr:zinc finger protein ztf-16 isoform X2 [Eupeodes corollae]XP_055918055.1 zinc finger protein ztf-16 isoform X2 [Eupeodes corollae]XP_055918056.1 zinc finger protein ztf-16 isoform X2 [Eupeodes corollae]
MADSGTVEKSVLIKPEEHSFDGHEKVLSSTIATEGTSASTNFRCERCDTFETNSRPSLLLHMVQCLSSSSRLAVPEEQDQDSSNGVTDASQPGEPVKQQSSSRKVFECDVCNMKFSNGANMRRHKMRHTGVKPYECRVCQKRFFRKDHLAEHFTTHTKTLPYHCPICNRGFQRQIAMRAHFQNEHVGQHDLVKTCPLCSYRAGSMKSLRIHFFNRHGIDLDNPGPGGPSSLLLALESQGSAAAFVQNLSVSQTPAPTHSDSGESLRSTDNATPPMHFLTPHVEISMTENGEIFNNNQTEVYVDPLTKIKMSNEAASNAATPPPQGDQHLPTAECIAKTPTSTSNSNNVMVASPKSNNHHENHITPSISLIPIKQEPSNDETVDIKNLITTKNNIADSNNGDNESEMVSPNSRLSSLIKVSPLKSLLREDLKRRICARANNRINRSALLDNNNVMPNGAAQIGSCNSSSICNGTITSSGQDTDSSMNNRKQILPCLFCGIEFPDETLYFLHKGCHSESNPWKCNICGEQCNNVYEFNSHLLSKSHQ